MSALAWACALGWIGFGVSVALYCIAALVSSEQIAELRAKLRTSGAEVSA